MLRFNKTSLLTNFFTKGQKMRAKKGFTLVEILIVVVILGILAAIVIPQFTEASTEAKVSSLCTDLQTLRSQIELYKVQHNDTAPALATFLTQMSQYSDIFGATQATKDATHCYGPYLLKIPVDQFNNKVDAAGNGTLAAMAAAPDNTTSWMYDAGTGAIKANDTYDVNGDGTANDNWIL
jgi:general secretion pathway protein G